MGGRGASSGVKSSVVPVSVLARDFIPVKVQIYEPNSQFPKDGKIIEQELRVLNYIPNGWRKAPDDSNYDTPEYVGIHERRRWMYMTDPERYTGYVHMDTALKAGILSQEEYEFRQKRIKYHQEHIKELNEQVERQSLGLSEREWQRMQRKEKL